MPDQRFSADYAETLLRLAEVDLGTAAMFLKSDKKYAQSCFLARQVVEACLKVVLIKAGEPLPSIADIRVLLAKLPMSENELPFEHELFFLELYSAASANPDEIDATRDDAEKSFQKAAEVRKWAYESMKSNRVL